MRFSMSVSGLVLALGVSLVMWAGLISCVIAGVSLVQR